MKGDPQGDGPDLHDPAAVEGWLFRIATTVCLDHLRRARRTRELTELVNPVADSAELCWLLTAPDHP